MRQIEKVMRRRGRDYSIYLRQNKQIRRRHRPGPARAAGLPGEPALRRGIQEETRGGLHRGGLLRVVVLSHLLHAQRLRADAGEVRAGQGRHGGLHARHDLRDGAQDQRHGAGRPRPDQRQRLRPVLRHRRPTHRQGRHRILHREKSNDGVYYRRLIPAVGR